MKRILQFLILLLSINSYAQCVEPYVFSADQIGMNSASLTWIELGSATSWQVVVQAPESGYPDPADAYTATTTFYWPVPSEDLAPATTYEYWIRSDCGNGSYSTWVGPYYFTTQVCEEEDKCTYKVTMWGVDGGTWAGNTMFIYQNGYEAAVLNGPIVEEGPLVQEVQLCDGVPFELYWQESYYWPEGVGVSIANALGQIVYSKDPGTGSQGTTLYTGMVDCDMMECLPPGELTASNPTLTTIDLSWAGPAEGQWEYYIVEADDSGPSGSDTGTMTATNPAVGVGNLDPATEYKYYVRMICDGATITEWAGPYYFRTSQCDTALQCDYTFTLYNTPWSIGWLGGYMTISQNGVTVAEIGKDFTWGYNKEVTVKLCTGEPFEIFWNTAGGNHYANMALDVVNSFGQNIFALPFNSEGIGTVIYEGIADCESPICMSPSGLTTSNPTLTTVDLAWEGPATGEWEYYITEAGQPAPSQDTAGILTTANPTLGAGPLTGAAQYEYYVRTLCDGTSTPASEWAGPHKFSSSFCEPEDKCTYTFVLTPIESWDLGGNYFTISQEGTILATIGTFPFAPGELSTDVELCPDVPVTITGYKGWFTQGLGLTVYTPHGEEFYTMQEGALLTIGQIGSPGVIFNGTPSCDPPTCLKPTNLSANNISMDSVMIEWTEEGDATQWEVFVVEQGSQAPLPTTNGIIANTNPATITEGIEPGKEYEYYVRAVCGEGDKSAWTGPYYFTSSLCSLDNQCAYTFTMSSTADWADGWLGDSMEITQGGVVVATLRGPRFADGNVDVVQTIHLCSDIPFSVQWINSYGPATDPHIGLSITHGFTGEVVLDMPPGDGIGLGSSVLYNAMAYCSEITCPQPTNLRTFGVDVSSVNLDWEPGGTENEWEVIVQEAGGAMPQLTDLEITASVDESFYQAGGLQEGILYEYYVRAVCGEDDDSFWSGPYKFSVVVSENGCSVEIADANNPDLGSFINGDEYIICPGEDICLDFEASYVETGLTTKYKVEQINYAPSSFTGGIPVAFPLTDVYSEELDMPFNFCFYGQTYNEFVINPKGMVSFDTSKAGQYTNFLVSGPIPSADVYELNGIYGVFQATSVLTDNEFADGDINYQVVGSYPCRKLIVNFNKIAQMACTDNPVVGATTSQIVLHEVTNVIEVYVQKRIPCLNWGSDGIIGIQNASGAEAVVPEGYNAGPWEAHNVAFRFTPDGPSNVVFEWLKGVEGQEPVVLSTEKAINFCADEPSQLIARATYTLCDGEHYIKESAITVRIAEPIIAEEANDITICGESAETVNLDMAAEGMVTQPELYNFSYYLTEDEATQGDAATMIPAEYTVEPGTYELWVRVERNNERCFVLRPFTLTVNLVVPVATFENVTACESYTLPELATGNYFTGQNGTGAMLSSGESIFTSQTIYIYNQSGTTPNCTSQSSFEINIVPTLEFNLGGPYVACEASNVIVAVNPVNFDLGEATYVWTVNNVPVTNTESSITVTEFGTYSVTVTLQGCSSTQSVVVVQGNTNVVVEVEDYCEGSVYMIEALPEKTADGTPSYDPDAAVYEWKGPNGFTASTKIATIKETGNYTVTVTTADGCTGLALFEVTATGCSIQKGISPNGDGLNDVFDLSTLDVKELKIFNRYGQEVYGKVRYMAEWHGQSNINNELPTGTYYYMIERNNGEQHTGWIYINRAE